MAAPASYARRQFPGAAADTTIVAGINASATSITLTSAAGWPTGTYTGGILCELYSTVTGVTAEKVWAEGLSGTTLTVLAGGRAADGSSAVAHSAGTGIRPVAGAVDADEANKAVNETVGQITGAGQILVGDGAASMAAVAAGTSGRILVGNGTTLASVAVSGDATLSAAGALSIGASKITNAMMADDAIDSAEIADGAVDLAHMSANSVDSDQYVDGSIDTAHIAASQITQALMADDAVGLPELVASAKPRWSVGPFFWTIGAGDSYGVVGAPASGVSSYAAPEACAVIGVSAVADANRTSGSISIVPRIDLADTSLALTIDAGNPITDYATQAETVDTMTAGQGLQVYFDHTSLLGATVIAVFVHLQAV